MVVDLQHQSTKSVVRTSKNGLGGYRHSPAKTTTYKLKRMGVIVDRASVEKHIAIPLNGLNKTFK